MALIPQVLLLLLLIGAVVGVVLETLFSRGALPQCRDCGAPTPGGPRCESCAHEHVEGVVRYGAFCAIWKRVAIQVLLRERKVSS